MKKVIRSMILIPALAFSVSIIPTTAPEAAPPNTCEPLCVTSPCTQNSDCTAGSNGRCDFVCPQKGCCVYN